MKTQPKILGFVSTPKTEWMTVTPEHAAKLLASSNNQNRRVRETRVNEYAEAMRAGRWRRTHQGIAIDSAGVIVDGQHRLHAVVKAGVPVTMLVTTGLDPLARLVVDTGLGRIAADSLKLVRGGEHLTEKQAIVKIIRTAIDSLHGRFDAETLAEYVDRFDTELTWLCNEPEAPRLTVAPVLAAFAYAYRASPDGVRDAFSEYREGTVAPVEPMGKLREHVKALVSISGHTARIQLFHKSLSAIHARLHGEKIDKLYASQRSDWFRKFHQ